MEVFPIRHRLMNAPYNVQLLMLQEPQFDAQYFHDEDPNHQMQKFVALYVDELVLVSQLLQSSTR